MYRAEKSCSCAETDRVHYLGINFTFCGININFNIFSVRVSGSPENEYCVHKSLHRQHHIRFGYGKIVFWRLSIQCVYPFGCPKVAAGIADLYKWWVEKCLVFYFVWVLLNTCLRGCFCVAKNIFFSYFWCLQTERFGGTHWSVNCWFADFVDLI